MDIVIAGDGAVGYALSQRLGLEGHSITIIENDREILSHTLETLDVMGILGNGASLDVQVKAGVPDADLLIAATSSDELNMICCITAKHLGAKHTIARIRNPEYLKQLTMFTEQFGLSMVINPEMETAREINRVLKFPAALKVDTFARGRAELVEFWINPENPLAGKMLMELGGKSGSKILICAVDRAGEVHIPNGKFVLNSGDKIYITGENRDISDFVYSVGDFPKNIRSVIMVGGGRVCYYLSRLLDDKRYRIKIIEKNRERCEKLCELLPKAEIIHGDGSDLDLLESEGIDNVDAFVSLTGTDEENMVMSMVAIQKKVDKVITKINRFDYKPIMDMAGIGSVINPKLATTDQIARYVRAMQNTGGGGVNTIHKLVDNKAEALEFTAGKGTKHLNVLLEKLELKPGLILAAIVRRGKVIIPHGKDSIQEKDDVVVVTTNRIPLKELNDIFR